MITPDNLVSHEVHYCVSYLVSTLAGGYGSIENTERLHSRGREAQAALSELTEQAMELASPVDDWEEAATQAGWSNATGVWRHTPDYFWSGTDDPLTYDTLDELQRFQLDEPYQWDVFEHWIISDWLADKLAAKGEKVDKDFAGMTVWARTTSGQGIASDSVIEAICAELNAA